MLPLMYECFSILKIFNCTETRFGFSLLYYKHLENQTLCLKKEEESL